MPARTRRAKHKKRKDKSATSAVVSVIVFKELSVVLFQASRVISRARLTTRLCTMLARRHNVVLRRISRSRLRLSSRRVATRLGRNDGGENGGSGLTAF